jgi:hypothetical protein
LLSARRALIKKPYVSSEVMSDFVICLLVQFCLAFGVAGLFWPEKLMPIFEVLMFPWNATYRGIRVNSIASVALSLLLFARLLMAPR